MDRKLAQNVVISITNSSWTASQGSKPHPVLLGSSFSEKDLGILVGTKLEARKT